MLVCPGCKCDLSKAQRISPEIYFGRLQIECPLCRYLFPIKILPGGWIEYDRSEYEKDSNLVDADFKEIDEL